MQENKISVLISDDHSLMRQGLEQLLEMEDDIIVVGQAENGLKAIERCRELEPDVMLLDINMPIMNGIEALQAIKNSESKTKVIILTIHNGHEYLLETINIGAEGYMLKDADADSLVNAIRTVNNGSSYIHPTLAEHLVKHYSERNHPTNSQKDENGILTKREYEVISLIADGMSNKEIADNLFISEKTVKNHVSNIFKKIDVNDRTQAAIYAFKNKIKEL